MAVLLARQHAKARVSGGGSRQPLPAATAAQRHYMQWGRALGKGVVEEACPGPGLVCRTAVWGRGHLGGGWVYRCGAP